MNLRRTLNTGFILLLMACFSNVYAHEVKPTIAQLTFAEDRSFTLNVETAIEALVAQIPSDVADTDDAPQAALYDELRKLPPAELENKFRAFLPKWLAKSPLSFGEIEAGLTVSKIAIPPVGDAELTRDSIITLSGTAPAGIDTFIWAYPEQFGASVLRINRPDQELQAQFFPVGGTAEPFRISAVTAQPWWQVAWTYIVSGFDHIVPKGLDHILFVLGLFFLSPQLRPLLWQVSAFTLAHTVTLALGLYGVIQISPSIVEPLIALSIVYVAVENILTKTLHPWRPIIVFCFGLLHGLGFAGVLAEFGLPAGQEPLALISFNVGVEFGQLFVIAVAAVLVGWAFKRDWYRSVVAIPASLAIGAMGAYWFFERTFA